MPRQKETDDGAHQQRDGQYCAGHPGQLQLAKEQRMLAQRSDDDVVGASVRRHQDECSPPGAMAPERTVFVPCFVRPFSGTCRK